MLILGIETSCDESAAALVRVSPKTPRFDVLSSVISSQIKIHTQYGGVVPEVAARHHVTNLLPVIQAAFEAAKLDPVKRTKDRPDLIAATAGPGLATSLMIGLWTAQTLSLVWKIPVVGANHMQGHLVSNWLDLGLKEKISLPALGLTVSGGHTELAWIPRLGVNRIIGRTHDDAAGEAYDKTAKLLGLGYPGGPIIDKLSHLGRADRYELPRPMLRSGNFDFSFSGLKTAVLYLIEKEKIKLWSDKLSQSAKQNIYDLCASFQDAVIDVLVSKTVAAAERRKPKTLLLAGGVAANSGLRARMRSVAKEKGYQFRLVPMRYTTDNAAMIAAAGYLNRSKAKVGASLEARPNWEL